MTHTKENKENMDLTNYRALKVLSQGNHSIIHILEEAELLPEICRVFVEEGKYLMVWFGMIEEMQNELDLVVRSGSESIQPETLLAEKIQTLQTGNTEIGTHSLENQTYAVATFPLKVEEEHVGILQVYAEEGGFEEEEVQILQQLIDNVSYALTEARFEESEEEEQFLASQKWDALGKLSAGIAHDFNNVLVPIIGFTEIVLESLPPDIEVKTQLEQALKTAYRAKDITQQILAFSRRETQTRQKHSLTAVIQEHFKLLQDTIPATIHVSLNLEEACLPALLNPSQLGQVLVNLCMNAQDAMNRHGELKISVENVELQDFTNSQKKNISGSYVILKVQDDGYGIPADDLLHVFEPLFSTQKSEGKAGLGLSAALRIAEAHRGFIEVESQVGQGTSFSVYLPALMSPPKKNVTNSEKEAEATSERKKEIFVLFVDDEEPILSLAQSLFARSEFTATFAKDGDEALEIFQANPKHFDLLLTDYAMPVMDGLDLAGHIREIRADIPILLCTGNNDPDLEDVIHLYGIQHILRKPYGTKEFKRALWQALEG